MIGYLMAGGVICLWALVFMLILKFMFQYTNFFTIYALVVYVVMTISVLTYFDYVGG